VIKLTFFSLYPSVACFSKRLLFFLFEAMLLANLRSEVLEANLELVRRGLVLYTFGNASAISRNEGLIVIKPSGVPYERLKPEDMVICDLHGKVVEGTLRPSSDLPTHAILYKAFPAIGGIAHTHSEFAVAWAQAGRSIPCMGTTHADYFHGPVPVTAALSEEEIATGYEEHTGQAIVRAFQGLDPLSLPGVLVRSHAPFTWGPDATAAAHNSVILETVARMAYRTAALVTSLEAIPSSLHDKHFLRKHGSQRYYGQDPK
jgi:L-ribulose-5-phosphate 4-epimerase